MSHEGVVLLMRVALVLGLILVAAIVRTFIGPSKSRGFVMAVGMLGGMALGVALSYLLPSSLDVRESAGFAICGMLLGFGVAWFFAKNIPRRAN
jgi:hypothetical protein